MSLSFVSTMGNKPLILACANPLAGHVGPVLSVVKPLMARGYKVTFVTGPSYRDKVLNAGADFVPVGGRGDFFDDTLERVAPLLKKIPEGVEQTGYSYDEIFTKAIPDQFEAVQKALKLLSSTKLPVVLVAETMFMGGQPLYLGAPGLKADAYITLGIIPVLLQSSEGPSANPALYEMIVNAIFTKATNSLKEILQDLRATKEPRKFIHEQQYYGCDRFLQLCPPSIEYPLKETPPNLRFAGSVPHAHAPFTPPSWWDDVLKAKRVVTVTQGTSSIDYNELLIPTMEALKDEKDILVVAILGYKGYSLPEDVKIPANARVIDYLPYDDIFEHTDALVYNGGYGGLQHSLSHAVPVIIGGKAVDKPAVAWRAEYAGVGIDLKTATPSLELIRESVFKILNDKSYKERSEVVQKDLEKYTSDVILEQSIAEILGE